MLQRGQLPSPPTCESGQFYYRKLLLEALDREVDNMQMVRTQWDRVWILCLHKWSPTGNQQVRRPFFLENSGILREEQYLSKRQVQLISPSVQLKLGFRVHSSWHCMDFSRRTKAKSLVGLMPSVLVHSSSISTFSENHRKIILEQLSSLQREKENQRGNRMYSTGGNFRGVILIFSQGRHFLKQKLPVGQSSIYSFLFYKSRPAET